MESDVDYILRTLIENYFQYDDGYISNGYHGEGTLSLWEIDPKIVKDLERYVNDRGLQFSDG